MGLGQLWELVATGRCKRLEAERVNVSNTPEEEKSCSGRKEALAACPPPQPPLLESSKNNRPCICERLKDLPRGRGGCGEMHSSLMLREKAPKRGGQEPHDQSRVTQVLQGRGRVYKGHKHGEPRAHPPSEGAGLKPGASLEHRVG